MILPDDVLIRETPNGTTVWVSQRIVVACCDVSEDFMRAARLRYKQPLPASWQRITGRDEFFLGAKPGTPWRWGKKDGQCYYDLDTIPNRKPTYHRDKLPTKEDIIALVGTREFRAHRKHADQVRAMREQVAGLIDNTDIVEFMDYSIDGRRIFNAARATQLANAVAWCKFIKQNSNPDQYRAFGFGTLVSFHAYCVEILSADRLEGLKVSSIGSLRNKMRGAPDDPADLREYLISGRYGNDNRLGYKNPKKNKNN